MKQPFLELEREAWLHLAAAYSAFVKLKSTHPSHQSEFADGIHACQAILGNRVLQRDYPYDFATYDSDHGH